MLTEVEHAHIEYIALNLRAPDREEIFNILPHDSPVLFAWQCHQAIKQRGRGRIAWHEGKPAACVAFIEHRTGVWDVTLFGTDAFKNAAFPVLRWIRGTIPELRDQFGGRRLQCDSRVGHDEAHRFLMALGAERDGPAMRHFGKDGSAYQRFVWINGESRQPLLGIDQLEMAV